MVASSLPASTRIPYVLKSAWMLVILLPSADDERRTPKPNPVIVPSWIFTLSKPPFDTPSPSPIESPSIVWPPRSMVIPFAPTINP